MIPPTYGRGTDMMTSFSSISVLSNSYIMLTSQPLPVGLGQQFTGEKQTTTVYYELSSTPS